MNPLFRDVLGVNLASVLKAMKNGTAILHVAASNSYMAARTGRLEGVTEAQLDAIPVLHLDDLLDLLGCPRPSIRLTITRTEDGPLPWLEAVALLALLVVKNPKEVLEIGTYKGHTSKAMAENLSGATVHTVDLPLDYVFRGGQWEETDLQLVAKRNVGREFRDCALSSRIRQHFHDTAIWDFSEVGSPGFFFIDGAHDYEHCKNDSEKSLTLCHGGEFMLWHDCDLGHPGVVRFLHEWRSWGKSVVRIAGTRLAFWKVAEQTAS